MPLYEYECESCGNRFERIQKFSDPPVDTCPACGAKVRRLISSPAIQFKGSGWYITDYAKKSGGGEGKSGKESKESKESSTDSATKKDGAASESSSGSTSKSSDSASSSSSPPAGSKPSSS
jgi:putative FmdB family regulatory protein